MRASVVLVLKGGLLLLFALLFQQCEEGEGDVVRLKDQEYLPLSVGLYQVYQITETIYVNGPEGETTQYQLKTEIVDSLAGPNGSYTYVLHRATRMTANDPWTMKDTWSITFSDTEAIVQQGNTAFVKLKTPLSLDLFWNGNRYNALGEETYTVTAFAQPLLVGDREFADVVEVTQNNEVDDIVGNDVRKEAYARGVGLISRTEEVITYCSNSSLCIGQQIIEQGKVSEQFLLEYGKK